MIKFMSLPSLLENENKPLKFKPLFSPLVGTFDIVEFYHTRYFIIF